MHTCKFKCLHLPLQLSLASRTTSVVDEVRISSVRHWFVRTTCILFVREYVTSSVLRLRLEQLLDKNRLDHSLSRKVTCITWAGQTDRQINSDRVRQVFNHDNPQLNKKNILLAKGRKTEDTLRVRGHAAVTRDVSHDRRRADTLLPRFKTHN